MNEMRNSGPIDSKNKLEAVSRPVETKEPQLEDDEDFEDI